jgi:hypothetical protein
VASFVIGPTVCEPEIGSDPDQSPAAVQAVALVEIQVIVSVAASATDVEVAVTEAVGMGDGGVTATLTEADPLPPAPVQVSEKVAFCMRPATVSVPETGFDPDQPSEAVQPDAFVEVHVSFTEPPAVMED